MSLRSDIIARALDIPRFPAAVGQGLALLGDPDVDLDEAARVLELDPGLTANILRIANSTYFGAIRTVRSVREAMVRLGVPRVLQIAIASGAAPHVNRTVKGYDLGPGALRRHSIAVAVAAEMLGIALDITPPPHTFTAGLLANVGKTVLGAWLEIEAGPIIQLARQQNISFEEAELHTLKISHAEVGAMLLEFWNLPREIVNVVRFRSRPDESPEPDPALDLVHAGDMVARGTGIGLGVDGLQYPVSEAALSRIGLTREVLHEVTAALPEEVFALERHFVEP